MDHAHDQKSNSPSAVLPTALTMEPGPRGQCVPPLVVRVKLAVAESVTTVSLVSIVSVMSTKLWSAELSIQALLHGLTGPIAQKHAEVAP